VALKSIRVIYGHLEGTDGKFARDPSGYLSIDKGIFARHGLDVSWEHVQGTEERYRRLDGGAAQLSLVVGRASLQHFLISANSKILGCAMNSCPYLLISEPAVTNMRGLKSKTIVCREGPARGAPLGRAFAEQAELNMDEDFALRFVASDQEAFLALTTGKANAALLPRPYGFIAEEQGFRRLGEWPALLDDPLPITLETTETFIKDRAGDCETFLAAHREGIRYLKDHRGEATRMLQDRFAHSPALAAKTFDDYLVYMDERLTVDFGKFRQLLAQLAPERAASARRIASEWIKPGALRG
jgi:ABC-type nitrate/sulfonate/bicarbonate transport system substrate-binding protein